VTLNLDPGRGDLGDGGDRWSDGQMDRQTDGQDFFIYRPKVIVQSGAIFILR